jgi:hypothetical protein
MSESAKDRAAREAAEQRKRQVEALENEKAGLKQRIAGSTDDAEKARLESRVKQCDESISFHKKAPAGRSTSASSNT